LEILIPSSEKKLQTFLGRVNWRPLLRKPRADGFLFLNFHQEFL
jgi:hypothetical protein